MKKNIVAKVSGPGEPRAVREAGRQRRGEYFLLAEQFLWGWFPIVTVLSYRHLAPLWSMAITLLIATLFFAGLMVKKNCRQELARPEGWPDLAMASLLILLLFILLFAGLARTTAGNAALILFMQVFFAFCYFNLGKRERMSKAHLAGAALMSFGALLVLFPGSSGFNRGDLLVLAAAMIAPAANRYQQRARALVSAGSLLFVRNLLSLPFIFLLAWLFAPPPGSEELVAAWWLLLLNGLVLMGLSKLFWVEALHRMSITKASAMTALSPLFTLLFAYPVLGEIPNRLQLLGMLPILLGGMLITSRQTES